MTALRCVLVGSESLLIQCALVLARRGHLVVAVVSDRASVRQWAAREGVRVLRTPAALLESPDLQPIDVLLSITNLQVLGADILALPRVAAINFHDGPLPEYAGLNAPVWALLNGATSYGITWHRMTADVDRGNVLVEQRFELDGDETALTLNTKNYGAAVESFERVVDLLDGGELGGTAQTQPIVHYHGRKDRPAAMAALDWHASAAACVCLVRALDFGSYANPVASAKVSARGRAVRVVQAEVAEPAGTSVGRSAGHVALVDANGITVSTADGDVVLSGFETLDGRPLTPVQAAQHMAISAGQALDSIDAAARESLDAANLECAAHEHFWLRRLETRDDYAWCHVDRMASPSSPTHRDTVHAVDAATGDARVASVATAMLGLLARLADRTGFDVGLSTAATSHLSARTRGWFSAQVPMRVPFEFTTTLGALRQAVVDEFERIARRGSFALDAVGRAPELRAAAAKGNDPTRQAVVLQLVEDLASSTMAPGSELSIALAADGHSSRWHFDPRLVEPTRVAQMQAQCGTLLATLVADPRTSLADAPLMDEATLRRITVDWNDTEAPTRTDVGVHRLIEEQVGRTPDKVAVRCGVHSVTYAELDARANKLARRLASIGVKPDVLVGLMCDRSIEMMVGLLAIHKAGGAYVPLDPTYPRERIAYMLADAKASVVLTLDHLRDDAPRDGVHVLALDADWPSIAVESDAAFDGGALPEHLAYVIYTSGSTGKPKGVMVQHGNVVNFFAGMDRHLGADEPGRWLAVTSLSFDISVLELCWTLTRGFEVVLAQDEDRSVGPARGEHAARPIDFSLFYFSSDESEGVADKYKLLLEGAKYADQHGFKAVWTPERHFHAFGGLYPNPAVTGAAIAAITQRVQVRAGSVVLPLHHPARVAEEWSVVDNISKGRVGISVASGWQPNDFVLQPQNFADAKGVMLRNVETLRALWRGEKRSFDGPLGKPIEVSILPRPVQKELPLWVTSAGNPETFAAAGRLGANVLTHLLGQSIAELKDKLEVYRKAWREAGHAGEGYVSLMLHTFVGPDEAMVRAKVKQPLIEYLRSSLNLVKQYAWSFPAFKRREGMNTAVDAVDLTTLSKEEMDGLLEHSFERYYETSGLFGTPTQCVAMVDALKAIGVDDVACLIDFGVDSASVLAHLPQLDEVRRLSKPPRALAPEFTLPSLLAKQDITHLQCTPSMARMMLLDDTAKPGLARLRRMMVGGEALQPALAAELTSVVPGTVMNMYGPTETTIWSAVHPLGAKDVNGGPIPLGRPLVNQSMHILDRRRQPMPVGVPGELVIGGAGVVRGYLHRPELTDERFVVAPTSGASGRLYRTGDLARWREDGLVEFLGRLDHQVKVRGYRIELGEIEAALARHPDVSETVVVAREDTPGDVRLVAYVVAKPAAAPAGGELRESLRDALPDFMVPSHVVLLDSMPQTPNGKIDRSQLPMPAHEGHVASTTEPAAESVAPQEGLQQAIADVWKDVLKLPRVGARDNFFDLGGHSLLAIQVLRALKEALKRDLVITDIFRFPTIESLSAHLSKGGDDGAAAKQGQDRAQGRRAAMAARRQGVREPSPN